MNFDLNYDITGKDSRPEFFNSVEKTSDNDNDDSDSNLQFDHRNGDADSYGNDEDEEREHLDLLKRDSDLLDDKDILELQAAQSILESCGLSSGTTSDQKKHNFRPGGMSLGFIDAVNDQGDFVNNNEDGEEKDSVREEEDLRDEELYLEEVAKNAV